MEKVFLNDFEIEDEKANEGICFVLSQIEPDWKEEEIQIKKMALGNQSCNLYKCSKISGSEKTYVVRIFNVETPMMNHTFELKVLQVIEELQLFTKIAAIFKNGVCYNYIEGVPFYCNDPVDKESKSMQIDDEKLRLIAERLVEIHSIKIPEVNYEKTPYFKNLINVIDKLYPEDSQQFPSKDTLRNLVYHLENRTHTFPLVPLVTCHGDFQLTNILWNESKKKVTVIDWEMCHVGHRAFDIAYFLVNLQCLFDIYGLSKSMLPEDYESKILKFYLRELYVRNGLQVTEADDSALSKFTEEVAFFKLVAKLFHVCVSVPFVVKLSVIPEFYTKYILQWLEGVNQNKDSEFNL